MKTIYLVSVQPETVNQMPSFYYAETVEQIVAFIDKYEHGSVSFKILKPLPNLIDEA